MKIYFYSALLTSICISCFSYENQCEHVKLDGAKYDLSDYSALVQELQNDVTKKERELLAHRAGEYIGLYTEVPIIYTGTKFLDSGHTNLAFKCAEKAIHINQNYAESYLLRGWIHQLQRNLKKAESDFTKAIELDPIAKAYQYRSQLYYYAGQVGLALKDMEKALSFDLQDEHSLLWLGKLYFEKDEFEKAIGYLNQVIVIENSDETYLISAYRYRGISFKSMNNYKKALEDFDMLIKMEPNDYISHQQKAHCYYEMGDYENAFRFCKKGLELNPSDESSLWKMKQIKEKLSN